MCAREFKFILRLFMFADLTIKITDEWQAPASKAESEVVAAHSVDQLC